MDSEQLLKAFTATVQASLHGLQTIEPVLRREQDALTGRDPGALDQVVREKLELLKQIEHGIHARDRLQQTAGFGQGLEGGQQLVDAVNNAALARDWSMLVELASQVAELNNYNGQLAVQGQRSTRMALGILTGRNAQEDTYSTLRRKRGPAAGYNFGKA